MQGDFLAYINERDGLGFLKGSQDSALQQLVSFYFKLKLFIAGQGLESEAEQSPEVEHREEPPGSQKELQESAAGSAA